MVSLFHFSLHDGCAEGDVLEPAYVACETQLYTSLPNSAISDVTLVA